MPKLSWSLPAGAREMELAGEVVLGRSAAADIVIEDETVSRRHARIACNADGWAVEDLGSGNGTLLNGMIVRGRAALTEGDELTLGRVRLTFGQTTAPAASVVFAEGEGERLRSMEAEAPVRSDDHATLSTSDRLRLIADVASSIAQSRSESELYELVASKLFAIFPQCERACVILIDQNSGDYRPRLARSRSGSAEEIPVSRTVVDEVVRARRTVLSADASNDERFSGSGTVMQFRLRTLICAPMIAGDRVLGALQIDGSDASRPFTDDDLATLLAIAAQTALATTNSRSAQSLATQTLITQDLALAKRIQTRFLPENAPAVPRYTFEWFYSPALGVGGDYYDFIRLNDQLHAIVIADVSGKGISAALYMAKLSSEVRYHAAGKTDAAEIIRRVNKAMLREMTDGMFVTLLLAVLNSTKDELQIASAGHMSPLLRRRSGEIVALEVPRNEPLGMPNYGGFEQEKFKLERGDVVTTFTDGITEAMSPDRALFGDARLLEAIRASTAATPASVKASVLSAVETFCDGTGQNDDITLISFGAPA